MDYCKYLDTVFTDAPSGVFFPLNHLVPIPLAMLYPDRIYYLSCQPDLYS